MSDEPLAQHGQEREHEADAFARQAEEKAPGLVREFWDLVRHNKKWWLSPIIVSLLLMGALIVLSSSALAPFIYTLF